MTPYFDEVAGFCYSINVYRVFQKKETEIKMLQIDVTATDY